MGSTRKDGRPHLGDPVRIARRLQSALSDEDLWGTIVAIVEERHRTLVTVEVAEHERDDLPIPLTCSCHHCRSLRTYVFANEPTEKP